MKTRPFIIFIVVFLVTSIGSDCYLLNYEDDSYTKDLSVNVNRLVCDIEDNWDSYSSCINKKIDSKEFDYTIIDSYNQVLIYTVDDMSTSVSSATKNFDVIRSIVVNDRVVGTLIVHNPGKEIEQQRRLMFAGVYILLAFFMLVYIISYFIYIRRQVIKPFGRMKVFASQVASGNLDFPLIMDKNNIFGAFTESFDIMREELKNSKSREEAALRSRKELVASLSHDIKTPVASIKAMTEVMQMSDLCQMDRDTLDSIALKADQIDSLVSNLFHATLEELEQLSVENDELSSRDLVDIIRESDYKNKISDLVIPDCVLSVDKLRIEQVVNNILSNSYKYADTSIRVESKCEDKWLVLSFIDAGGGVKDEELDMILEKFKRGSNSKGKNGSGLGLYISRYLMEKMNGSLTCENVDKGLCVTIYISLE